MERSGIGVDKREIKRQGGGGGGVKVRGEKLQSTVQCWYNISWEMETHRERKVGWGYRQKTGELKHTGLHNTCCIHNTGLHNTCCIHIQYMHVWHNKAPQHTCI